MDMRIGQGIDVHAYCEGQHVMLGGVRVPHSSSVSAHSDGDVVLHALCDAVLGALALGDIGQHFPPEDPKWADADSRELLRGVMDMVDSRQWLVINADITIVCEAPRIAPHVPEIRDLIASDLAVNPERISVKATTTEKLGFFGRGEGIGATAIVLLGKS